MNELGTLIIIKHGIMAFFSAIVHALIEYREGRSRTFVDILVIIVISSFSGVMFGLMAIRFFPHDIYLSLAITGTGGVLGVEGVRIITKQIVQMFKITLNQGDDKNK